MTLKLVVVADSEYFAVFVESDGVVSACGDGSYMRPFMYVALTVTV
jgi:hypothetical protein